MTYDMLFRGYRGVWSIQFCLKKCFFHFCGKTVINRFCCFIHEQIFSSAIFRFRLFFEVLYVYLFMHLVFGNAEVCLRVQHFDEIDKFAFCVKMS